MSVSIKYKGTEIASASTETTKTIKTAGKYCEADILVENTPDGGDAPVINPLSVTANGTYTAPSGVDGYSPVTVNVPQGITPTGNINITDTNVTDVTQYATAQVVDADLIASNIKKDVNILGVVGTFEGGGGTEITDGIVVKARDANGYATEIDYYGDTLYLEQFSSEYPNYVGWRFLETINLKNTVKHLQDRFAYGRSSITTLNGLDFAKIETSQQAPFDGMSGVSFGEVEWVNTTFPTAVLGVFHNCLGLTKLKIHLNSTHISDYFVGGCTNLTDLTITGNVRRYGQNGVNRATFYNCTALRNVSLGNIGTAISSFDNRCFTSCTQTGLTITAFTDGAYAGALLANIRNGATNATIIIKASESTTYNGVSYAAGETMITSNP